MKGVEMDCFTFLSVVTDFFRDLSLRYLSLAGGLIVLAYAIYRMDPVFILAYLPGNFVYLRNLYFIYRKKKNSSPVAG